MLRGEPTTESPTRKFSYVPADDLLTSPELSSANSQGNDLVLKVEEDEGGPSVTADCSTRKALFNDTTISRTPHIQFTCVVTPSKSVGRYSTRSNLEMSRKVGKSHHNGQQQTVEKESKVVRKDIFDDSLEEGGADDEKSAHCARLFEFHDLHRKVVSGLEERCVVWEGKMAELQQMAEKEDDPARYEEGGSTDIRIYMCCLALGFPVVRPFGHMTSSQ